MTPNRIVLDLTLVTAQTAEKLALPGLRILSTRHLEEPLIGYKRLVKQVKVFEKDVAAYIRSADPRSKVSKSGVVQSSLYTRSQFAYVIRHTCPKDGERWFKVEFVGDRKIQGNAMHVLPQLFPHLQEAAD